VAQSGSRVRWRRDPWHDGTRFPEERQWLCYSVAPTPDGPLRCLWGLLGHNRRAPPHLTGLIQCLH